MTRTQLISSLVAGAALLVVLGVWLVMAGDGKDGGSWPPSERAAFIRSCVEECRKSPGVTEDKYPLCDRACACSADEGERIMTAQELGKTATSISSGTASPEQLAKMDRVKAAGMRCVTSSAPDKK